MRYLIPIACLALAAYFIFLHQDGWGWCIFAAILTTPFSDKDNDEDD